MRWTANRWVPACWPAIFDMAVSSATLRNEMAALTRLGLLEQPHTSAGRVPSAKGYRYYLDHLLQGPGRHGPGGRGPAES